MLKKLFQTDDDVLNHKLHSLSGPAGDGNDIKFGRGTEVDIALDSQRCPLLISRRHAVLHRQGRRLFLSDTGSTNGTYVNEQRLAVSERREVRDGDTISFGGASQVRQNSNATEEPNPFLYRLKHLKRLWAEPLSQADTDLSTSTAEHSVPVDLTKPRQTDSFRAHAVIDLTDESGPSYVQHSSKRHQPNAQSPYMPTGEWPGPAAAPAKRKPAINLDSDSEVSVVVPPIRRNANRQSPAAPASSRREDNPTLKALENQFECQICREFMIGAHSLVPCGHMFCGECACEWLDKKKTCPACRQATTAAPVPCIKVDNIIDEIVVPHMGPTDRAERERRKTLWTREKSKHQARMETIHKSRSSDPRAFMTMHADLLATSAADAFHRPEFLQHALGMENGTLLLGNGGPFLTGGFFNPGLPAAPRQNARRGSSAGAQAQPVRAPPEGHPMFSIIQFCGAQIPCAACNSMIMPVMPAIVKGSGLRRQSHYHVGCESRIPGFFAAWNAHNGNIPGVEALGLHNRRRIQGLADAHRQINLRQNRDP